MATNESLKSLQSLADGVNGILAGTTDQASVRLAMKEVLAAEGYQPDPEKAGGLEDLGSTARLNLALETQVDMARGAGWFEQGQQAGVLDEWPAQELYRAAIPKGGVKAERDWPARWQKVGGEFVGNRMVALKTDPVWKKLGDPALFTDGLGNPYPPFAFSSGMDVRDIARDEAESLGLLDANTELLPQPADLNADLAASPATREQWLRDAITGSGLGRFDAKGVLHFNPERSAQ